VDSKQATQQVKGPAKGVVFLCLFLNYASGWGRLLMLIRYLGSIICIIRSLGLVSINWRGRCASMYRLLHEYGYLHYFRDLRNGIIITKGKARGDYCAILKVSKERRYLYSCNNLFRLWLEVALSVRVTNTNSDFLIELVCVWH